MKPFLRFIISAIVLIACCAVADCLIGVILDKMIDHVPNNGNEIGTADFAIKEMNDPVLIVGSSRARDHYFPSILSDSLSLSTYNIGRPGHFVSYFYCMADMILDRYTPGIIIWELDFDSLFIRAEDRISSLKPYYWDNSAVREVIDEKEGKEAKIKLMSSAFRYNGIALNIIQECITGGPDYDSKRGMSPLKHTGNHVNSELSVDNGLDGPIDQARVKRLRLTLQRLVDVGVKVVIIDSPHYALPNPNRNLSSESIIYEECQRLSIPVIDNRYLDFFLQHPEMFRDKVHLFEDGAEIYTKLAAHQIVEELKDGML